MATTGSLVLFSDACGINHNLTELHILSLREACLKEKSTLGTEVAKVFKSKFKYLN